MFSKTSFFGYIFHIIDFLIFERFTNTTRGFLMFCLWFSNTNKKIKMNKYDARKIAEVITNEQLKVMLIAAKNSIKNWTKVSNVNKSFTIGLMWNILAADFDTEKEYHILAKTNMIREFGRFLPNNIKSQLKKRKQTQKPVHQIPKFDNFKNIK